MSELAIKLARIEHKMVIHLHVTQTQQILYFGGVLIKIHSLSKCFITLFSNVIKSMDHLTFFHAIGCATFFRVCIDYLFISPTQ